MYFVTQRAWIAIVADDTITYLIAVFLLHACSSTDINVVLFSKGVVLLLWLSELFVFQQSEFVVVFCVDGPMPSNQKFFIQFVYINQGTDK